MEGDSPANMARTTGLAIIELASIFEQLEPRYVLTVADRYETLATAIAASYMNICLIHTQGGELTGSIDESVRHAVTKLAHIHFPATEEASRIILQMGECSRLVKVVGCPSIDLLRKASLIREPGMFMNCGGVGAEIADGDPYLLVVFHPVTTEYAEMELQIRVLLDAVTNVATTLKSKVVWLWPNADAGSDIISSQIRRYREYGFDSLVRFFKNFSPENYAGILSNASCAIGNSSSFIREGSFLGVPAVMVGSRQRARERAENVIDVEFNFEDLVKGISKQAKRGPLPSSKIYGDGNAAERMLDFIRTADVRVQKQFHKSEQPTSIAPS
jgi:UDP-hydrolysing UDP-N-acetyl-D-glucosamine 2-epimerase